jgi:hypothetical protein
MAKRKRKKNPAQWVSQHPWMTFFLGLAVISTVGAAVGAKS